MDARALIAELTGARARFIRLARSRVATDADAEDVVQRALMRAAERASSLAEPGRAEAWFYRILRRAIVDHHRSRPREVSADDEVLERGAGADEGTPGAPCRCAAKLVTELRPAYGELIRRIDQEEEDPRAVAESLGVSVANLYVRLHRARRALRERLEGHCGVAAIGPCLECSCNGRGRCGD